MTANLQENVFSLPGGLLLPEGKALIEARLRALTGREEDWLARHTGAPSAKRVTALLSACLLALEDRPATLDLIRQLLVGDRDYLVLQLRRLTLGENIQAVIRCPSCGGKMDVSFAVSEVPVEVRRQTASSYTLPLSARTVSFRLPNGGDQEAVLGMTAEEAETELLKRCTLDDGGRPLSGEEQQSFISTMEKLTPQVELDLDLTCPECGHAFVAPFDTTAFFFEEMALNGEDLLHEIHALALYYHWSESAILRLERGRRRSYLRLLNESLRQN